MDGVADLFNRMRSFIVAGFILCAALVFQAVRADLVTYPGPDGIRPSKYYRAEIIQNGQGKTSFVYVAHTQTEPDYPIKSEPTSWTTFSFSDQVTVKITKLKGEFTSCKILPTSYAISAHAEDNKSITFDLDQPRQVSVEFDGDVRHPMLVFANPLEKDVPNPEAPGLHYFGPGVQRDSRVVETGQTVYLAGGAYVKGRILGTNAAHVTIRGRGILSGEEFEQGGDPLIRIQDGGSHDVLIEGITLVNSPNYNIDLCGNAYPGGGSNIVTNVKMIGYHLNSDGVRTGHHGRVENCFFKVNDDAVKLYDSGMRVRNCVLWQMENGAPFQISWNMQGTNHDIQVSNCDVIRTEHKHDDWNNAVFASIHGGEGYMHDYLFEDIRIENAHGRLFSLLVQTNKFQTEVVAHPNLLGRISDLTFRNITVDGSMVQSTRSNRIRGWDAKRRVSNVTFQNLKTNGKLIGSKEDGHFDIDPATTQNIQFITAP